MIRWRESGPRRMLCLLAVSLGVVTMLKLCPGNAARSMAELASGGGMSDEVSSSLREAPAKGERGRYDPRGAQRRRLPEFVNGTLGKDYDVKELGATAQNVEQDMSAGSLAIPPPWDSSLCMLHWGLPELQDNPDPNGYIIFVNGREQLGGNKFLVSDGLYMAKILDRTFVEYPVQDSRVASFDQSSLGLGAYWDLSELCMYHRILDLRSFRRMVADGRIPPEEFVTVRSGRHELLARHLQDGPHIVSYFEEYRWAKVIAMESAWKSSVEREPLQFLKPNSFYLGVIRMLLGLQKDWAGGKFIAVQWRTELASGNLTECYEEVKSAVEQQRIDLGYGTHQVLFNADFYGKTSGTYKGSAKEAGAKVIDLIKRDYPKAFDNVLHHFVSEIEDSGVKAFVSGLAVASSQVMFGSSMRNGGVVLTEENSRCEKPYSGYIWLISDWRRDIMGKPTDSVVRLFSSS